MVDGKGGRDVEEEDCSVSKPIRATPVEEFFVPSLDSCPMSAVKESTPKRRAEREVGLP